MQIKKLIFVTALISIASLGFGFAAKAQAANSVKITSPGVNWQWNSPVTITWTSSGITNVYPVLIGYDTTGKVESATPLYSFMNPNSLPAGYQGSTAVPVSASAGQLTFNAPFSNNVPSTTTPYYYGTTFKIYISDTIMFSLASERGYVYAAGTGPANITTAGTYDISSPFTIGGAAGGGVKSIYPVSPKTGDLVQGLEANITWTSVGYTKSDKFNITLTDVSPLQNGSPNSNYNKATQLAANVPAIDPNAPDGSTQGNYLWMIPAMFGGSPVTNPGNKYFITITDASNSKISQSTGNFSVYGSASGAGSSGKCPYGYYVDDDKVSVSAAFSNAVNGQTEQIGWQSPSNINIYATNTKTGAKTLIGANIINGNWIAPNPIPVTAPESPTGEVDNGHYTGTYSWLVNLTPGTYTINASLANSSCPNLVSSSNPINITAAAVAATCNPACSAAQSCQSGICVNNSNQTPVSISAVTSPVATDTLTVGNQQYIKWNETGETNSSTVIISFKNTSTNAVTQVSSNNQISAVSGQAVSLINIPNVPAGTYTVTVTDTGNSSATGTSAAFKVVAAAAAVKVTSVTVTSSGSATTVAAGSTLQINASVLPVNATNPSITWLVINETGSATISSTGLLTAGSAGSVLVVALTNDQSGVYGSMNIIVNGPSSGVSITAVTSPVATDTLTVGNQQYIKWNETGETNSSTANISFTNTTTNAVTQVATNAPVAVSANQGSTLVTIPNVPAGTYTATVTDVSNSNAAATSVAFNIVAAASANKVLVTNIQLDGEGSIYPCVYGGSASPSHTLQMNATVIPSNATNPAVTWSASFADNMATISSTGLLTASSIPTSGGTGWVMATAADGSGVSSKITVSIIGATGPSNPVCPGSSGPNLSFSWINPPANSNSSAITLISGQTNYISWNSPGFTRSMAAGAIVTLKNTVTGETTAVGNSSIQDFVGAADDGYFWNIPSSISNGTYTLKIADAFNTGINATSAVFNIAASTTTGSPFLNLTFPNTAGQNLVQGQTYNITWTDGNLSNVCPIIQNLPSAPAFRIELQGYDYIDAANLSTIIAGNISAGSTNYSWTVPATLEGASTAYPNIKMSLQIFCYNQWDSGTFTALSALSPTFNVVAPPVSNSPVTIVSPQARDQIQIGSTDLIKWTSNGTASNVNISIENVFGGSPISIATNVPASQGSYSWKVDPKIATYEYVMQIADANNPSSVATSYPFKINNNSNVITELHINEQASTIQNGVQQITAWSPAPGTLSGMQDQTRNVIWSVDDTSIAAISQTGLLKWLKYGYVNVTATANDVVGTTAAARFYFYQPGQDMQVLSATGATSVEIGSTLQMNANYYAVTNRQVKNIKWTVNPGTGAATINSTTGLLTGTAVGTVIVEADDADTMDSFGPEDYGTKTITVTGPASTKSIAFINGRMGFLSVNVDGNYVLSAGSTWTSSGIANVNVSITNTATSIVTSLVKNLDAKNGSFTWSVDPSTVPGNYIMTVSDESDAKVSDTTGSFVIVADPNSYLYAPNSCYGSHANGNCETSKGETHVTCPQDCPDPNNTPILNNVTISKVSIKEFYSTGVSYYGMIDNYNVVVSLKNNGSPIPSAVWGNFKCDPTTGYPMPFTYNIVAFGPILGSPSINYMQMGGMSTSESWYVRNNKLSTINCTVTIPALSINESFVCDTKYANTGNDGMCGIVNDNSAPICTPAVCNPNQYVDSCGGICPNSLVISVCGDGKCDATENATFCPQDCSGQANAGPICGDGVCQSGETTATCPKDCPAPIVSSKCGDGTCDIGESYQTCPQDCKYADVCQTIYGSNYYCSTNDHDRCQTICSLMGKTPNYGSSYIITDPGQNFYRYTSINVYNSNGVLTNSVPYSQCARTSYTNTNADVCCNCTSGAVNPGSCTPNWVCTYGDCVGGQRQQTCTDSNNCGTTNVPAPATQSCGASCTPLWVCNDWGTCSGQYQDCAELNNCGITNTPACVNASNISGITVTTVNSVNTVAVGKVLQMYAVVPLSNIAYPTVTWSVAPGTGTASIDNTNNFGTLTGLTPGTVTVTATINGLAGGAVTGSEQITVTGISNKLSESVTAIAVSSPSAAVAIGSTLQFSAAVLPSAASNPSVTWSVVNGTGTATVSSTGLLTPVSAGTVTVTATAQDGSGVSGTKQITVNAAAPVIAPSISMVFPISTTKWTIGRSNRIVWKVKGVTNVSISLTNTATPSAAPIGIFSKVSASRGYFTWKLPTNLASGTYTITVTSLDDPTITATSASFQVLVPVTKITVAGTGSATTVVVGSTLQMVATVVPTGASNAAVTWSIATGTKYATIDATTGILTAIKAGPVTVRATAKDGSKVRGSVKIKVTAAAS